MFHSHAHSTRKACGVHECFSMWSSLLMLWTVRCLWSLLLISLTSCFWIVRENWNQISQWSASCLCDTSRWQSLLFKVQSRHTHRNLESTVKSCCFCHSHSLPVWSWSACYQNVITMPEMQMNDMAYLPASHETHRGLFVLLVPKMTHMDTVSELVKLLMYD